MQKTYARVRRVVVEIYAVDAVSPEEAEEAEWDELDPELITADDKSWEVSFFTDEETDYRGLIAIVRKTM